MIKTSQVKSNILPVRISDILPPGPDTQMQMQHTSHPEIVSRLKRAEGHLRKIIGMIEEGRPCLELAQQLQAIENAIDNAKKALIHDHISHCIDSSLKEQGPKTKAALKEFKAIAKYL
jgi:uncharacterized protein